MIYKCPIIIQSQATAALRRTPIFIPSAADITLLLASQTLSAGDMKVSKNGANEINGTGTLTEFNGAGNGNGWYYYEWALADIDTRGFNLLRLANASWAGIAFAVPICNLEDDILGAGAPNAIETGVNHRQAQRIAAAGIAGLLSGLPAGPAVLKGLDLSTTRISVTFDANNNRTSITYTLGT